MAPHPSEKVEWRRTLLDQRQAMTSAERSEAAEAIAIHSLVHPLVVGSERVACYLSMPSEPGTSLLVEGLHERGTEVLMPRVHGEILEWVSTTPDTTFSTGALGMREPDGPPNSLDGTAVVILPALAIDHHGHRLGRGAGFYDRALAGSTVPRCALVFAHELVESLPHEDHDIPVDFAISPHGVFRIDRS